MKRNTHCIVPAADFHLESGEEVLRMYTFNTGVARHTFCGNCGICPFYRPRSNPDCYAGEGAPVGAGGDRDPYCRMDRDAVSATYEPQRMGCGHAAVSHEELHNVPHTLQTSHGIALCAHSFSCGCDVFAQ